LGDGKSGIESKASMMDAFFIKINGALHPASDHDRELLKHIKAGEPARLTFKRVRNYEFHKKWFKLMDFAFERWETPSLEELPIYLRNTNPEKNFDRFRKDVTILAGYYTSNFRLNGDVRIEAKSIAFGNMPEDEFEKLYAATIDLVIKYVDTHYSGETLRELLSHVEGFE